MKFFLLKTDILQVVCQDLYSFMLDRKNSKGINIVPTDSC
jgi:hypothetical protein